MKKIIIAIMVMITVIIGLGLNNEAFGMDIEKYDVGEDVVKISNNFEEVFIEFAHHHELWDDYDLKACSFEWDADRAVFKLKATVYDHYLHAYGSDTLCMTPQDMYYVYYSLVNALSEC